MVDEVGLEDLSDKPEFCAESSLCVWVLAKQVVLYYLYKEQLRLVHVWLQWAIELYPVFVAVYSLHTPYSPSVLSHS